MTVSFQTRIVLLFSALFLSVQIITLFCAYTITYDNALKQLGQNLVYAQAVFNQLLTERGERMASEARILVADFGFRTTVSTGDTKTIASALENLTLRIRGKRAFYVALSNEIVADTGGRYQASTFMFPAALLAAERQGRAVVFGRLDGELCEWAIVPVLAPIPIGWVVVAIAVDPRGSERLRQLSALPLEISMIEQAAGKTEVLSSTLSVNMQKRLGEAWSTAGAAKTTALNVMVLDKMKLITQQQSVPSALPERPITVVLQIDFAEALKPYWFMLYVALALLVFGLIVILFGAIVLARKIAQPLKALAGASERMLDGQFDLPLPVTSQDELGRMAKTFNRAAQLATQMHALKQKDQARREMVATVSHDLRNPLTALHTFLETLQLKAGSLPAHEQQRFLEVALRQSKKVNRLAQELFELAKLECDEQCLNLEPFSMEELLQDVAQKFQLGAEQKRVKLLTPAPQGLPMLTADIGLIERLLSNLIDNAIRNTPSGGEVKLTIALAPNTIKVSITDTGIGIPAQYLPTLFDWESPLSHRARADAGGFGLVIVAKILNLHEGRISVDSTLGQGSNFCFELPISTPVISKP